MEQERIIFEFTTQYGTFRDALHLPLNHGLTDEELNAMKQERLDNWLTIITTPPIEAVTEDG